MQVLIKKVKDGYIPKQAKPNDAGYDAIATSEPRIVGESIERPMDGGRLWRNIQFIEYETNLYIMPQTALFCASADDTVVRRVSQEFHTLLFPRSSISKKNLSLCNSVGLIDKGYTGQLLFRFKYYFQPESLIVLPEAGINRVYGILEPTTIYAKGDAIGQLSFTPTIPAEFELVMELPETERQSSGFGSSDKK